MKHAGNVSPAGNISYLLLHVANVVHQQSDQALQERLGIGLSQFKILALLQGRAHTKQRDVASYLGQTEASISRQVALLQERGLLTSRTDPDERRRHIAALTVKGAKLTQAAHDILDEYHEPLLSALNPKQREQLLGILTAFHDYTCVAGKPFACNHSFKL